MEDSDLHNEHEVRRPLAMTLLGGLYLFFFILTVSTYGHPIPLLGVIYQGRTASLIVFVDSLVCLYLYLGLMKRQHLTWYLLLAYNTFEVVNTITNLLVISPAEIEKFIGDKIDTHSMLVNNISVMVAVLLLSAFIFHHRDHFTNHSKYLF